jgi:hypothetical protein
MDTQKTVRGHKGARPIGELTEDQIVRFLKYVEVRGGQCWEWRGATISSGYGSFRLTRTRTALAHRVMAAVLGHDDPNLEVDHSCGNRRCCSPAHLEPVTQQVNIARQWEARRAREAAAA